jgi:CheY-like chemotaxis protein
MALILVVEDEEASQQAIKDALAQSGHGLLVANDGEEGARLLESALFDLVILDLMMPKSTGFELLQRIQGTKIPVVICSAYVTAKASEHLKGFDPLEIVRNPFRHKDLLSAVQRLLPKNRPVS